MQIVASCVDPVLSDVVPHAKQRGGLTAAAAPGAASQDGVRADGLATAKADHVGVAVEG